VTSFIYQQTKKKMIHTNDNNNCNKRRSLRVVQASELYTIGVNNSLIKEKEKEKENNAKVAVNKITHKGPFTMISNATLADEIVSIKDDDNDQLKSDLDLDSENKVTKKIITGMKNKFTFVTDASKTVDENKLDQLIEVIQKSLKIKTEVESHNNNNTGDCLVNEITAFANLFIQEINVKPEGVILLRNKPFIDTIVEWYMSEQFKQNYYRSRSQKNLMNNINYSSDLNIKKSKDTKDESLHTQLFSYLHDLYMKTPDLLDTDVHIELAEAFVELKLKLKFNQSGIRCPLYYFKQLKVFVQTVNNITQSQNHLSSSLLVLKNLHPMNVSSCSMNLIQFEKENAISELTKKIQTTSVEKNKIRSICHDFLVRLLSLSDFC
jgi:hypothetical protein